MSEDTTSLTDRIELRRFVGREFLLWLWFESELFTATLSTKTHGSFGFWLEGRLALSADRESTVIKGISPGNHREAKEALLRGKMPERMDIHLSLDAGDATFALRGDTLAISALSPPAPPEPPAAPEQAEGAPRVRRKRRPMPDAEEAAGKADDAIRERMRHAHDIEQLIEALYRDFLVLRLSPAWEAHVRPALQAWVSGREVVEDAYRAARDRALSRELVLAPRRRRTPSSALSTNG
jgi:hypothetical protein